MKKTNYGYSAKTRLTYEVAIATVTDELQKEGFGILTEIDVAGTLKKKLELDFRRYVILGACNPHFASRMLAAEIEIGLLMPCNVIVYENDDKTATVALLSLKAQFQLVQRPDLAPMVDEVERIIERVARAL